MERLRKRVRPTESGHSNKHDSDNTCLHCEKQFSRADTLKDHLKAVHDKSIRCAVCSKTFSSLQKLRRHQLVHTDEKNHRCQDCSQSFGRKDSLTYHMNTVHKAHPDAKQLSFSSKCEFCVRYECPRHQLISVMKRGSPYTYHQCTVCLKITSNCCLNWSHQHKDHANDDESCERGHQCDTCRRVFTSSKALRRHSGGKCYALDHSKPLWNSGERCISDAQMQAWMKKEISN